MNDSQDSVSVSPEVRKRDEFRLFVFLIVALFPILAVAVVGSYGFMIWMSQVLVGPPGPAG